MPLPAASSVLPIPLSALDFTGSGLARPECVLATRDGMLYTADWRGGVARVAPDGSHDLIAGTLPGGRPLRPNGIALRRDGSFLLADLGETAGGVFALNRMGAARLLCRRSLLLARQHVERGGKHAFGVRRRDLAI